MSLQRSLPLCFSISLFSIQNQSFFGVNNPKNDQVCMEIQLNIEINWRGE